MLSQRFIVTQRLPRYIYNTVAAIRHHSSTALDPHLVPQPELRLSAHRQKLKTREPFVKSFFMGQYDLEFAAFPEPQTHERHKEFFEWLQPIEDYVTNNISCGEIDKNSQIPSHVFEKFKEFGVFRAPIPEEFNGLHLNYSESAKLIESVSSVPVLGAYLARRAAAVELIVKFASEEQKSFYLPKIASGEFHPTICINENSEESNDCDIEAVATRSVCNNYWILNGTKTYVANAESSDLFIVLAACRDGDNIAMPENLISAFFVERNFGGITVGPPTDMMGLRGMSICEVQFKDTHIPQENIIGSVGAASKSFSLIYGNGKQNIGSQAIGLTRHFLKLLVNTMKQEKDFNRLLFKNDAVQESIGKICCDIYGMESVVYLTTGMMDNYSNQDCDMEKCIVETFCADACVRSILRGIQVLGSASHKQGNTIEQLLRDALCLNSFDGHLLHTKVLITLLGFKHVGKEIATDVRKRRNPLMNPSLLMTKLSFLKKTKKLCIADNLHPSLESMGEALEYGIITFEQCVNNAAIRHGQAIFESSMEMRRISDVVTNLYVLAAVLSHASRSYCLGMRDGEKEIKTAQIFGYFATEKIQRLEKELEDGDWINGDFVVKDLANSVFEKDSYFLEHPLARNF